MKIAPLHIICVFLISLGLFTNAAPAQSFYGTTDVETFREGRHKEFQNRRESPLLKIDFEKFKRLNYYEITNEYRVKATYVKTPDEKYFLMPTSTGRSVKYTKVGVLIFRIDNKEYSLNAYQSSRIRTDENWSKKYGHAFFIPFKDLTNGKETYSGGRYIYMKVPESEHTMLDFNLTFSPSCAYGNDRYACPLPPRANHLKVNIRAGEKIYKYTKSK